MEGDEMLRIGVISTAAIGLKRVIPGIAASQRCRVDAIASRTTARAEAAARELGIPTAYGSYEALLADPDVDAIYNPLPNHLHTEWNLAAIRAGKHVLAEKPLAMNAAEAESVFTEAERNGVKVVEAFMYRTHPTWREVKRLVDAGEIGPLRHVQTFFGYRNLDPANIRNITEAGGGALYDVGCYAINSAILLFGGEPEVIGATIDRHHSIDHDGTTATFGTDTVTAAVLRFPNGTATFACATALEHGQWVHIIGEGGRIELWIPFNIPLDMPTYITVAKGGEPPVAPDVRRIEFAVADQYATQADAFAAHVLDGEPPAISPAESLATMRTIDAVFATAR
jgi:predicted dehydrogenase